MKLDLEAWQLETAFFQKLWYSRYSRRSISFKPLGIDASSEYKLLIKDGRKTTTLRLKIKEMADSVEETAANELALPIPIIVVIAVGSYILVIVLILVIRQFLVARGICVECAPCGQEDGSLQCCDCWIALAESCNCCAYPNIKTCLDAVCGPATKCAGMDCACQAPECESIDCLCFKIQLQA
ncbi:uncharacterized protein LOC757040 isoform X2 [Strongylocentrotus purpuratus]|uniref:Uncharacterized protein n=2 Tax=Strongylocentrotus purpuratus TaxID=7668 RepID=A0A7M7T1N1_STRPU|nr:uncharacterized protein LOC757040 isoform X2 [Strongylocentrotus purpuratus]